MAVGVRLAAAVYWQQRVEEGFYFGDSESYWTLARQLAAGGPYQYGGPDAQVFRTPGYPLLLAPLFLWTADPQPLAARVLGCLCGVAAVGCVFGLATTLFDRVTGLLSAALATFYPGGVVMSVFVLSEALFAPLAVAQLWFWGLAWKASTAGHSLAWYAATGAVGGLATLTRPSWLLFTPLAACAAITLHGNYRREVLGSVALMGTLVLTMLPWWIRNAEVTGHFVPTSLQVGASLYDGLNPTADGSSNMEPGEQLAARIRAELTGEEASEITPAELEYQLDRRLRDAALAWAAEHPGKTVWLAGQKLARLWNPWPNAAGLGTGGLGWLMVAGYVPIIILAAVGVWRYALPPQVAMLCWWPAVYFTALHVVFVSSIRYREPAMLPLIVLAAAGGMWLLRRRTALAPLAAGT